MVAILVFGIVLVGMLDICSKSILMGKRSNLSYTAYNLAKNHLETLKASAFSSLTTADETDTILDGTGIPDPDGQYKRNTAVTTNYSGDTDLASVTVTVDYEVKGTYSGHPVTLSTVIFQNA